MLKRIASLAFALFAGSASAAGAFDGIYQLPGIGQFYSVHQNGNQIIVGLFYSTPQNVVFYNLANGQRFTPPRLDNWDLFGGTMSSSGSSVRLTGETAFGACNGTVDVFFSSGKATVNVVGFTPTAAGIAQGINCTSLYNAAVAVAGGSSFSITRIF